MKLILGLGVTGLSVARFFNKNNEEKGFEQRFSFYKDYTGQSLLTGSELDDALNEIFERITQDIFNKSLANW